MPPPECDGNLMGSCSAPSNGAPQAAADAAAEAEAASSSGEEEEGGEEEEEEAEAPAPRKPFRASNGSASLVKGTAKGAAKSKKKAASMGGDRPLSLAEVKTHARHAQHSRNTYTQIRARAHAM